MKKFYYKKNIPQEEKPILQTLERSHTLLNALASDANSSEWHELPLRRKSKDLSDRENRRETMSSIGSDEWSANSTVITDSDLASSWIYSRKKAAANSAFESVSSDPVTPPADGHTYPDPSSNDIESPRVDFKRIPIAPNEEPNPSCCCYMTILLIIFICSFGILASIGGVVYLEVFATPRTTLAADSQVIDSNTITTIADASYIPSVDDSITGEHFSQESSTIVDNQETSQNPDKTFQSRRGKSLDIESHQDDETSNSSVDSYSTMEQTQDESENSEYHNSTAEDQAILNQGQISSKVPENKLNVSTDTSKGYFSYSISNTEQSDTQKSEDDMIYSTMPENAPASREAKEGSTVENKDHSDSKISPADVDEPSASTIISNKDSKVELESKPELGADHTLLPSEVLDIHTGEQTSDTPTESSTRAFGRIQESIAAVMKKFQRLEHTLPNSRIKDASSTRRTIITTEESSTVEPDAESEKQKYLEKIRRMMFDKNE